MADKQYSTNQLHFVPCLNKPKKFLKHSSNSYFVAESTRKQLLNVASDLRDVTWIDIDDVELDDETMPGIPIEPP